MDSPTSPIHVTRTEARQPIVLCSIPKRSVRIFPTGHCPGGKGWETWRSSHSIIKRFIDQFSELKRRMFPRMFECPLRCIRGEAIPSPLIGQERDHFVGEFLKITKASQEASHIVHDGIAQARNIPANHWCADRISLQDRYPKSLSSGRGNDYPRVLEEFELAFVGNPSDKPDILGQAKLARKLRKFRFVGPGSSYDQGGVRNGPNDLGECFKRKMQSLIPH